MKKNKKQKERGFGLIMLLITMAIIAVMVWGTIYTNGQQKVNQVQMGQDAVQKAQDAADKQNQYNQNLQNQTQGLDPGEPAGVNYGSVRDKANSLK